MARSTKVFVAACIAVTISVFGNGCAAPADDADKFREGLPLQEEVALRVPSGRSGMTKSQGLRIATEGSAGEKARYYQMTRDLSDAVDFGTAVIIGGLWTLAHTAPTTIEPKKAVWGPAAANALEPAIWRFTVMEIGDAEYDYVLEGQSRTGGEWLTVLRGHGYGRSRSEHKTGWFEADNDAYRKLDPTRGRDEGSTKVTFDLTRPPATIAVELRPTREKGWVDLKVTHDDGGAGSVEITGLADVDPSKTTKLEDVHLVSRWTSNGSGRADVILENGDLPRVVEASECWSTSFARVYYEDTVDFEPASGDEKSCALAQAQL